MLIYVKGGWPLQNPEKCVFRHIIPIQPIAIMISRTPFLPHSTWDPLYEFIGDGKYHYVYILAPKAALEIYENQSMGFMMEIGHVLPNTFLHNDSIDLSRIKPNWYIGVRSCEGEPRDDTGYWGSGGNLPENISITHEKIIQNVYVDREEATLGEKYLLKYFHASKNPHFYNRDENNSHRFSNYGTKSNRSSTGWKQKSIIDDSIDVDNLVEAIKARTGLSYPTARGQWMVRMGMPYQKEQRHKEKTESFVRRSRLGRIKLEKSSIKAKQD